MQSVAAPGVRRRMDIYESVVAVTVVAMVVGVPMFALSVRLALRPMVEAWTKLREAELQRPRANQGELEAMKLRVAALEAVWEHRLGAGTLHPTRPVQRVD